MNDETSPLKKINEKAPYTVKLLGENSYCFTTDYGIYYEIGFIQDYMLDIDNVYQFFLLTKNGVKPAKDPKILVTVYAVLEEFFQEGNLILDYVCDTNDGRQEARSRLFYHWFDVNPKSPGFTCSRIITSCDGVGYYAAVVVRNDNPHYRECMEAIDSFIKNINDKLR